MVIKPCIYLVATIAICGAFINKKYLPATDINFHEISFEILLDKVP